MFAADQEGTALISTMEDLLHLYIHAFTVRRITWSGYLRVTDHALGAMYPRYLREGKKHRSTCITSHVGRIRSRGFAPPNLIPFYALAPDY
jgi:hypothetical protein